MKEWNKSRTKEGIAKWNNSEKGKAAHKKYEESEKGKAAMKRLRTRWRKEVFKATREVASNARQAYTIKEDQIILSGIPLKEICEKIGRSAKGVCMRKARLLGQEWANRR